MSAAAAIGSSLAGEQKLPSGGPLSELPANANQVVYLSQYVLNVIEKDASEVADLKKSLNALSIQITRSLYRQLHWLAPFRSEAHLLEPSIQNAIADLNALQVWLELPYEPEWAGVSAAVKASLTQARERLQLYASAHTE